MSESIDEKSSMKNSLLDDLKKSSQVCSNCIISTYGLPEKLKQTVDYYNLLNPLSLLFMMNVVAVFCLLSLGTYVVRRYKRLIFNKLFLLVPSFAIILTTACGITLYSGLDWIMQPEKVWSSAIKYPNFMAYFTITIFILMNSIGVACALMLITFRLKLLDPTSFWAIIMVTVFKVVTATSLFIFNEEVTFSAISEHIIKESVAINTYMVHLMKLLVPSSIMAALLFISIYRCLIKLRRKLKPRKAKNLIETIYSASNNKLVRSTSCGSVMESFNRISTGSERKYLPKMKYTHWFRLVTLSLVPIYLYFGWFLMSWVLTSCTPCCKDQFHGFKTSAIHLRETFLVITQSAMFSANFITLLLSLNFIVHITDMRRRRK